MTTSALHPRQLAERATKLNVTNLNTMDAAIDSLSTSSAAVEQLDGLQLIHQPG